MVDTLGSRNAHATPEQRLSPYAPARTSPRTWPTPPRVPLSDEASTVPQGTVTEAIVVRVRALDYGAAQTSLEFHEAKLEQAAYRLNERYQECVMFEGLSLIHI